MVFKIHLVQRPSTIYLGNLDIKYTWYFFVIPKYKHVGDHKTVFCHAISGG